ncbi:acetylornithine transaminase [Methanosarcinales archaeon]|nr:MAG: acetylornithine transaminase [Methanosarcinales archaeon]
MRCGVSDEHTGRELKSMDVIERERKHIMQTYNRIGIVIVEGKGAVVRDINGREYVDCVAGIAVNNVGHCNPAVVNAIKEQAERLIHASNLYYTVPQVDLAEKLVELTGMSSVFFCNSGAESVEAALKLAFKVTGKRKFIAAEGSFHGRTLGALSITHSYRSMFEQLLIKDINFVPYGDAYAIEKAIDEETAAVILEPIQGEGGVVIPPDGYLREVREICDDKNVLMILDEIQTGLGRTGKWFCKDHEGVQPDIMTVAKALGGGFPIGAMLARDGISFGRGEHASTFGGNPLACAAALAALRVIENDDLVSRSMELGEYFVRVARDELASCESVREVRGRGLMIGIELEERCDKVVKRALEHGVILNCTANNVIRLVPPLVISRSQLDMALNALKHALK